MWAQIENGEVVRVVTGGEGIVIGDTQHSSQIFGPAWTDEERAAIGLVPVVMQAKQDGNFWLEVEPDYRVMSDGSVIGERQYKARDLDEVKDKLRKNIKQMAARLITTVMKDFEQRNSLAEILMMFLSNGADLKSWPGDDQSVADKAIRDWAYIQRVRDESNKREAELDSITDMKSLSAVDWGDGWPIPD